MLASSAEMMNSIYPYIRSLQFSTSIQHYGWGIKGQLERVWPGWQHTPHFLPDLSRVLTPPPWGGPSVAPVILFDLGLPFGFNAGGSWIPSWWFSSACADLTIHQWPPIWCNKMTYWIPWNETSNISSCSCVWIPAMSGWIAACASWNTVLAVIVWVGTGAFCAWGCSWNGLDGAVGIGCGCEIIAGMSEISWCKEMFSFAAVGGMVDISRLRSWYQLQSQWSVDEFSEEVSIYRARTTPIMKRRFVTTLRAWK